MNIYTKALDIIKKATGIGSHGGHVIGHTRSGNPIYDSSQHEAHANFRSQDHSDAMNQHHELWSKTQEKIDTIRRQKPNWNPPKKVQDFLKHHYTQMQIHQSQMGRKGDREAKQAVTKSEGIVPFFSAVVVVDSKRKNFLLGKRLEDGQWTSPAGGAILGEFPKKTAIREVFEEAGIALAESQLTELPMGYAQAKPVHCFIAILTPEQMKSISVNHDPDEEVKKWEWVAITGKMPEPMDNNRAATMLNAKMHLAGLLMKSGETLDATEGMTSFNTSEFKTENEDTHPMKSRIDELMQDYESGDAPTVIPLDGEYILHLVKVDEGIFSGFVKRTTEEGLEETAATLDKMALPSIIQYLKAKEILKDETPNVVAEPQDTNLRRVLEQLGGMTVYGDVNITIKKAKALPVGTVRQWGVYKYVKHSDGWVVIGGEHHGKLMGNFKSEPSHADFARHHEKTSPKLEEPKEPQATMQKAINSSEVSEILRKSEASQKAQALPTGTIRLWHGQKFIKQSDGHWIPVSNGQPGQAPQPTPQLAAPKKEEPKAEPKPKGEAGALDHLKPEKGLGGHVELHSKDLDETLKNGKYSLISAGRNPNNPDDRGMADSQVGERHKRLEQDLKDGGHKYTKVKGQYGGAVDSYMVHHADPKEMNDLGKKYNQDSVIHSDGGENQLHFTSGENAGKHHKGKGFEEVPEAKDYYSSVNTSDGQQKKFSLNMDFGKQHEGDK